MPSPWRTYRELDHTSLPPDEIVRRLRPYLSEERVARIETVLDHRIDNLIVMVEDAYDPLNMSSIIRTLDGMGIQNFFALERRHQLRLSAGVTKGCHKWVDIQRFAAPEEVIGWLRDHGFTLYASHLDESCVELADLQPFPDHVALFFGNEHEGLSRELMAAADHRFRLPMWGFSQSFNLSVAVTRSLDALFHGGFQAAGLTPERKQILRAVWHIRAVHRWQELLRGSAQREQHR